MKAPKDTTKKSDVESTVTDNTGTENTGTTDINETGAIITGETDNQTGNGSENGDGDNGGDSDGEANAPTPAHTEIKQEVTIGGADLVTLGQIFPDLPKGPASDFADSPEAVLALQAQIEANGEHEPDIADIEGDWYWIHTTAPAGRRFRGGMKFTRERVLVNFDSLPGDVLKELKTDSYLKIRKVS